MMRTPEAILADFDAGCKGQADVDMRAILWEVIEDILNSVELALKDTPTNLPSLGDYIVGTVSDYAANHYGDQ